MSSTEQATLAMLAVSDVHADPDQPRKQFDPDELFALAENIKQHGVLQPIRVRPNEKGFVIVAGERRWRASKLAKAKIIPAIVEDSDDAEALLHGTIENVARADLNVIEALGTASTTSCAWRSITSTPRMTVPASATRNDTGTDRARPRHDARRARADPRPTRTNEAHRVE